MVESQLQLAYGREGDFNRLGSTFSTGTMPVTFGKRLRDLRKSRHLSQKALAEKVAINFTYLSKIENERLDFAQFPSEELIFKLAAALEMDEDELLILAKKVPPKIKDRFFERPDAFRKLANVDDSMLDYLVGQIGSTEPLGTEGSKNHG